MINELHQLSVAMREANISTESWHREYKPIPAVRKNAPCIRIVLSSGKVERMESIEAIQGEHIRKYGNNQGSFPAMNLAPLYRIDDKATAKELAALIKSEGTGLDVSVVKTWCTCNNWGKKFSNKYRISMEKIPKTLQGILQGEAAFDPVLRLIDSTRSFVDPAVLHQAIEEQAFMLLENRLDIVLALQILFYVGKDNKEAGDDYGSLSVVFDDEQNEISSVTMRFTRGFNQALLRTVGNENIDKNVSREQSAETDAFGWPLTLSNAPMHEVKLPGGFSVILRTMNPDIECQRRYRRIGNDTFPIGVAKRQQLADALDWLASEKRKNKTWVNTDKNEILFVYPSQITDADVSYTNQFEDSSPEADFETEAELFRDYMIKMKSEDFEHYPDNIQIFMLRKIDKARTKVVYTRCATPDEIIRHSDTWKKAARNLPKLPPFIARTWVPFPLGVANIMNCVWKRDGTLASEKYTPVASYHGMELLFNESRSLWEADLHRLVESTVNLAVFAGPLLNTLQGKNKNNAQDKAIWRVRDTLVLMGMFLYWLKIRKGDYVNEYPYLLGQMLKVSDSLHELYCRVVREKDKLPSQLVGSSMYIMASEHPQKILDELGKRMRPYIAWAKTHRDAYIIYKKGEDDKEARRGPDARYYLWVYEQLCNQLRTVEIGQASFNDREKAILFIGYLSSFPKVERKETILGAAIENNEGGNENE